MLPSLFIRVIRPPLIRASGPLRAHRRLPPHARSALSSCPNRLPLRSTRSASGPPSAHPVRFIRRAYDPASGPLRAHRRLPPHTRSGLSAALTIRPQVHSVRIAASLRILGPFYPPRLRSGLRSTPCASPPPSAHPVRFIRRAYDPASGPLRAHRRLPPHTRSDLSAALTIRPQVHSVRIAASLRTPGPIYPPRLRSGLRSTPCASPPPSAHPVRFIRRAYDPASGPLRAHRRLPPHTRSGLSASLTIRPQVHSVRIAASLRTPGPIYPPRLRSGLRSTPCASPPPSAHPVRFIRRAYDPASGPLRAHRRLPPHTRSDLSAALTIRPQVHSVRIAASLRILGPFYPPRLRSGLRSTPCASPPPSAYSVRFIRRAYDPASGPLRAHRRLPPHTRSGLSAALTIRPQVHSVRIAASLRILGPVYPPRLRSGLRSTPCASPPPSAYSVRFIRRAYDPASGPLRAHRRL